MNRLNARLRVRRAAAVNLHHIDPGNCGDMASSPLSYFESRPAVERMPIQSLNTKTLPWLKHKKVILGGSGLFFFNGLLKPLFNAKPPVLIGWGIGTNRHFKGGGGEMISPESFDLLGVRDWGVGQEWVPCVSCWSPLFDQYGRAPVTEEIVIYHHERFPVPIEGFKHLSNAAPMERVIRYLASADTILTSSYHGVYWATLLGKKVIMFPFSTKFQHLKYPVPEGSRENWREKLRHCKTYPEALEECRGKNLEFSKRVSELTEIDFFLKNKNPK